MRVICGKPFDEHLCCTRAPHANGIHIYDANLDPRPHPARTANEARASIVRFIRASGYSEIAEQIEKRMDELI